MTDIIDLNARRNAAAQPDPEHVRRDDFGRPLYRFAMEYRHDGGMWGFDIWAYDMADAQAKAASMTLHGVTASGQVYGYIPG